MFSGVTQIASPRSCSTMVTGSPSWKGVTSYPASARMIHTANAAPITTASAASAAATAYQPRLGRLAGVAGVVMSGSLGAVSLRGHSFSLVVTVRDVRLLVLGTSAHETVLAHRQASLPSALSLRRLLVDGPQRSPELGALPQRSSNLTARGRASL